MKRIIIHLGILLCALGTAPRAGAVPVIAGFIEDSRGDPLPNLLLTEELGDMAVFPLTSALDYHDHRHAPVGVPDDGVANDWVIHIKNVSGQAWKDLYLVADGGASIGNADGRIADLLGAPGAFLDAFRIDAAGINANLLSESLLVDGILQPAEEWEFVVSNFNTGSSALAPVLNSPGVFAGSSPLGGLGGSNASILANPVPEPSTAILIGLMGAAVFLRRPQRMYVPYL